MLQKQYMYIPLQKKQEPVLQLDFLLRFGRSSLRLTGPDFVHHFSPRKPALEDKMICGI